MNGALSAAFQATVVAAALALTGCLSPIKLAGPLVQTPRRVPNKVEQPYRPDARLAVLWVGYATVLIQLEDKLVLTDPVFTPSVGQMSTRLVEPGLDVSNVPPVDAVLISHMHFDHLSLGTLELLQPRIGKLFMPQGGLVYLTNFPFPAEELPTWNTRPANGLRITAAPVQHNGMRYGADVAWMDTSYTGYVIQYRGLTVYFGGDTAYRPEMFRETARRFPKIDLALMPIAPIEPREFMKKTHVSPDEAVRAFIDLKAKRLVPIHWGTFENSADVAGDAMTAFRAALKAHHVDDGRVSILEIGQQRVLVEKVTRKPGPR